MPRTSELSAARCAATMATPRSTRAASSKCLGVSQDMPLPPPPPLLLLLLWLGGCVVPTGWVGQPFPVALLLLLLLLLSRLRWCACFLAGLQQRSVHTAAPGTKREKRAAALVICERREQMDHQALPTDHSIFVGDLGPEVDDSFLTHFFQQYYSSVRIAKVMTEPATGRSRGYGFVRFTVEAERDRALAEMNGVTVGSRPIRCSLATSAKGDSLPGPPQQQLPGPPQHLPPPPLRHQQEERRGPPPPEENTTLFVGGLAHIVSEGELRDVFSRYGDIVYTRIPQGKGCGFVQFQDRRCAERAMHELNGTMVANAPIRISWGRSSRPIGGGGGGGGGGFHGGSGGGSGGGGGGYHHHPTTLQPHYGGGYQRPPPAYPPPYHAAPYGAPDPYAAGYAGGAYGSAAYGGYTDPSYAYAYGGQAGGSAAAQYGGASGEGGGAGTQGTAAPASAAAAAASAPSEPEYDPLARLNVDRANAAYIKRMTPLLAGSFLRTNLKVAG